MRRCSNSWTSRSSSCAVSAICFQRDRSGHWSFARPQHVRLGALRNIVSKGGKLQCQICGHTGSNKRLMMIHFERKHLHDCEEWAKETIKSMSPGSFSFCVFSHFKPPQFKQTEQSLAKKEELV